MTRLVYEKVIWKARAQSLQEVLDELIGLKREIDMADEEIQLPLVTLQMRSGKEAKGHVLDSHQSIQGGKTVLVWLIGGSEGSVSDTCYVDVNSIEAVIVHDRELFEKSKSLLLRGQPLSSLQLKRSLASLSDELAATLGFSLPIEVAEDSFEDSDSVRGLLFRVLKMTAGQIGVLASDEFGRKAVQASISRLAVQKHETQAMVITDRVLILDPSRLEGENPAGIRSMLNGLF